MFRLTGAHERAGRGTSQTRITTKQRIRFANRHCAFCMKFDVRMPSGTPARPFRPVTLSASALIATLWTASALLSNTAHAQSSRIEGKPRILSEKPDRTVLALEYVPAAGGTQKAGGIGVYRVSEDGPGLFVQFVTDLDIERPRVGGDPARFPEQERRRFNEITAITVGLTRYVSPSVTLLGGLGLVSTTPVTEKNDPLRRLSSTGNYFVEDGARRENRLGVQVGVQFNLQRAVVGASYNSEIGTPQLSVGYSF